MLICQELVFEEDDALHGASSSVCRGIAAIPPDCGAMEAPPSFESETLVALNERSKSSEQQRAKPAWLLAGLPAGCCHGSFRTEFPEESFCHARLPNRRETVWEALTRSNHVATTSREHRCRGAQPPGCTRAPQTPPPNPCPDIHPQASLLTPNSSCETKVERLCLRTCRVVQYCRHPLAIICIARPLVDSPLQ